jgi:putative ABC transport system substrate-binding protein
MCHLRCFVAIISILFAPVARAQTPEKTARIGMLCPVQCEGPGYTAFDDELRRLGWTEGSNLTIERKAAEGRYERLPELAAGLARSMPDLIAAAGSQAARAAKEATADIPVAFSFVAHPVELGLVQSLGRPGANVTGVAALAPGAFLAKQLEILRELLPRAQRVAVLHNPANDDARLALSSEVPTATRQFGWRINVIEVHASEEIPGAMAQAKTIGNWRGRAAGPGRCDAEHAAEPHPRPCGPGEASGAAFGARPGAGRGVDLLHVESSRNSPPPCPVRGSHPAGCVPR